MIVMKYDTASRGNARQRLIFGAVDIIGPPLGKDGTAEGGGELA
jgi:hypothetical protein